MTTYCATEATLEAAGLAPCGCDYQVDGGSLLFRPAGTDEDWSEICWHGIDNQRKNECLDIMAHIVSSAIN